METSLHRQLKALYVADESQHEVVLGDFRIDAVRGRELIEVQHGSLAAIRDKIRRLLAEHRVRVVKPIVARKTLLKLPAPGAEPISRRRSPKRGTLLDVFDELVYFTRVFPHPRLTLDVLLVEIEELRYPGRGKRRRRRRPNEEYQIDDQRLVAVDSRHQFRRASDLMRLLPRRLPRPFHTGHLAERMDVPRWIAQRIAYCLREMGAVEPAGKKGNAILYQRKRAAA